MINVFIEETLLKVVPIDAETDEEALKIADEMYRKGDIVLTADDFTGNYQLSTPDTEWDERSINPETRRGD